jgi:uncharacterized RmlC-like cupin family protein
MGVVRRADFVRDTDYEPGIEINWAANADTVGTRHVLGMLTIIPPGSSNPAHKHENAEALAYLMSGRARLVSGGKDYIVGPETFAYSPPGEVHQWTNLSDTEPVMIVGIYGGVNRLEDVQTVFEEQDA